MKCEICKIDYPNGLVQPLRIKARGRIYIGPTCGICALAKTNEVHGTERKTFHGTIAEAMRQAAIEFRKKTKEEGKENGQSGQQVDKATGSEGESLGNVN